MIDVPVKETLRPRLYVTCANCEHTEEIHDWWIEDGKTCYRHDAHECGPAA